jgi:outer membrane protein
MKKKYPVIRKNSLKLLLIINLLFLLGLFIYFSYPDLKSEKRIMTVNRSILFDNFTMTKDLKRAGENEFNNHIAQLDSVYSILQSQSISEKEKQVLTEQLISEKHELANFFKSLEEMESSKIWIKIQQYTVEFSKENNYQLIIGFENTLHVFDADKKKDKTQDLVTYINKRYEGLK